MYSERLENLIKAALTDGRLTEKEREILYKRAQEEGIDLDEFEMVLDARLVELSRTQGGPSPKNGKMGEVKKCPACGAIVNSFSGMCAECGYAFENIEANRSTARLSELLMKATNKREEDRIIRSFPIPMAKADLLEFISLLHGRVFSTNGTFVIEPDLWNGARKGVCYEKYCECIEKCRMSFRNDPQISHYIEEFDGRKRRGKRK